MLAKPSSRRSFLGALCLVGSFSMLACGSKQAPPPNPALAVAQNLHGTWRLKSFTPQKPLEQPYQGLLDAQLKALEIAFTGDTYSVSGPGITLNGRYQVTTAIGDQFDATLFDPEGVAYPVSCRFRGALLDFQSHNERWRGSGVLERAQAAR
ncbi:MAG TPA: hypothetical protein VF103_01440 [Polyangiaceae bacterium]